MEKKSKIVVTGGVGLVGSALINKLKSNGYENVISLGRKDCDLLDTVSTHDFFNRQSPDYVFHCAARVYGILGNMNNKGISFYENILINTNVVEASRKAGVKKIVAMGTGAVYPFPSPGLPLREEMIFMGNPHPAEDSYANAKRAMLSMLRAYEESYGLNWSYVVSCNLFGPNDKFDTVNGHVVPSLIKKFYDAKLADTDVLVWGNGSAQRDFMYVKDAASALISIMEDAEGAVNIGGGAVYSISQIVEYLTEITGMQSRVRWDSTKPNGQDYRAYDLSKLNATGFSCNYSIKDGLKETWDWYVNNGSNEEKIYS
jgi:GDP-L-fucose synthase